MFKIDNYTLSFTFDRLEKNGNINKVLYLFPLSIRIQDFEAQFIDKKDKLLFIRDCLVFYNAQNYVNETNIKKDFIQIKKDVKEKYPTLNHLFKNSEDYLISDFNSCKTINLLNYLLGHFIHIIEHYIPYEIIEDNDLFLEKSDLHHGVNIDSRFLDIECDKVYNFTQ